MLCTSYSRSFTVRILLSFLGWNTGIPRPNLGLLWVEIGIDISNKS
jgi:hypothetical protein